MTLSSENTEFSISEELRPRAARKLGIPLDWDVAIDGLAAPKSLSVGNLGIALCRLYRRFRPSEIGNRCCYEPSCSRYCEICFRKFGPVRALRLTISRLRRCGGANGGLDLPPEIPTSINQFKETFDEIQN